MGFEDREYSQEEWNASPRNDTPVTKWLVILTVVLFILQAFTITAASPTPALFELASLKASAVLQGQVWRLFTFVLCYHPMNILGLVFGLLITWQFGNQLERMYGSRELFLYYIATALAVGLSFTACGLLKPGLWMVGSSTISLSVLALYATHFPRVEVYILPMISVQLRWLVAIYVLFAVYPALMAVQAGDGIAALADASVVMSVALALVYRRYNVHFSDYVSVVDPTAWKRAWRVRASRRNLRVFQPADDSNGLNAKVDAILAKIHEHGSESLTPAERDVLARASEKYKNRP